MLRNMKKIRFLIFFFFITLPIESLKSEIIIMSKCDVLKIVRSLSIAWKGLGLTALASMNLSSARVGAFTTIY